MSITWNTIHLNETRVCSLSSLHHLSLFHLYWPASSSGVKLSCVCVDHPKADIQQQQQRKKMQCRKKESSLCDCIKTIQRTTKLPQFQLDKADIKHSKSEWKRKESTLNNTYVMDKKHLPVCVCVCCVVPSIIRRRKKKRDKSTTKTTLIIINTSTRFCATIHTILCLWVCLYMCVCCLISIKCSTLISCNMFKCGHE